MPRPAATDSTSTRAAGLRARLVAQGDAARARGAKAYLKSDLAFLGVTIPQIRAEARAFVAAEPALGRDALWSLVRTLWESDVHELRCLAIAILERRLDALSRADLARIATLIRASDTWAHVDWLATKIAGGLVAAHPALGATLDRWARDECMWLRRAALLALHDPILRGEGDFAHFAALALPMLGEREFFIRKAIGWVLRSASKRRPERTEAFVAEHARALSALSFREATRNLPARTQARLRALRGAS